MFLQATALSLFGRYELSNETNASCEARTIIRPTVTILYNLTPFPQSPCISLTKLKICQYSGLLSFNVPPRASRLLITVQRLRSRLVNTHVPLIPLTFGIHDYNPELSAQNPLSIHSAAPIITHLRLIDPPTFITSNTTQIRTLGIHLAVLPASSPELSPKKKAPTMVLTWTRFVPEHYDITASSLAPISDEVSKQPFPFTCLPVEIRLKIYKVYLYDRYSISPAEIHEMVLDASHRTKRSAEILQVSKAVHAEVKDLLQQEKTVNIRICWQDATFDGFIRSCGWARGTRLGYGNMAHLRIEIYPPHQDRPTDMVHIWKNVRKISGELSRLSKLQHISVYFMENKYAAWSLDGKPRDTLGLNYSSDQSPSDIIHILDLFKLLTNVAKTRIHLPDSLAEDVSLQKLRQETEDVMMNIKKVNGYHQQWVVETLEEDIYDNVSDLRGATGERSQSKLDRSCGLGYWISKSDLDIFEKIWPDRDFVAEWAYQPRSHYIGDETLENAPLTVVNHYRSGYYNDALLDMYYRELESTHQQEAVYSPPANVLQRRAIAWETPD